MSSWRLDKARLDHAIALGGEVVSTLGISKPPIDPFLVLGSESPQIRAFGDDFGGAFDGRIEYKRPKYLIFYNTKYDFWPHAGRHHPKTRFTVSHELGHYFLQEHRAYLQKGGTPHLCLTEFLSDHLVEREADSFAAGMLMPSHILSMYANAAEPSLQRVKAARIDFNVSLTSMMIRWTQLCDFPCATMAVKDRKIQWGFVSDGFKRINAYRSIRGDIRSEAAREFVEMEPSLQRYREGFGWGRIHDWLDISSSLGCDAHEDYIVIPSIRMMLVFLTVMEEELFEDSS